MSLPTLSWEWDRLTIGSGGAIRSKREADQLMEIISLFAARLPEEHSLAEIVHKHGNGKRQAKEAPE